MILRKTAASAQFVTLGPPKAIIDMMGSRYRTTRWLLVGSLIVSLGMAGLLPLGWQGAGARAATPQPPTRCCCGTQDARCCGMGCCAARQAPAKEPCPLPAKDGNRDGRIHPLTIALATAVVTCLEDGRGSLSPRPSSDTDYSLAESSLQARHVRLDV